MKTILSLAFVLVIAASLFAQAPSQKWKTILELEDQIVFLDTTSVKRVELQITALSLSRFKNPVLVNSINKNVSSIKSQLLFDLSAKKYTVIGNLFYDENWRIVGESSLPGFSTNTSTFAIPIDSNKIMAALFNACETILGVTDSIGTDVSEKTEKTLTPSITQNISRDSSKAIEEHESLTEKFIDKKLNEETQPVIETEPAETKKNIGQPIPKPGEEKNIYGTIFSDGSKYYFQVSSWKNKTKAEEEVARLKRAGHNAFISEAYIANKGGTWYRVRIGYFNSVDETEVYMNRLK